MTPIQRSLSVAALLLASFALAAHAAGPMATGEDGATGSLQHLPVGSGQTRTIT